MNLKPLADRVVVKPLEDEDKSPGGIILPDTAKEKPMKGEIVAVGPGALNDKGDRVKPEVKKGEPEPAPVLEPEAEKVEPEPAPVPVESAPAVSAGSGGEEIEYLHLHWRQFIRDAPSSMSRTPAAALLRSAKPKAIENNTVILSFKFPLHKENMEKLENQKVAEKIVSYCLGRACQVRCVHEAENNHLVRAAQKLGAQIINVEEK